MAKKILEKQIAAGDNTTSSEQSRFMVELEPEKTTYRQAVTRLSCTIPQLDGAAEVEDARQKNEQVMYYSFKSKHTEDTIQKTLSQMWPKDGDTSTNLVLRERLGSDSSDHLCTLQITTTSNKFTWPTEKPAPSDVFCQVKRIK